MYSDFKELSENEMMEMDGGFAITTGLLLKIGAGILIAGGIGMFGKGCYDGYKGK